MVSDCYNSFDCSIRISQVVKKGAARVKKRCENKGGGQEMAVMENF